MDDAYIIRYNLINRALLLRSPDKKYTTKVNNILSFIQENGTRIYEDPLLSQRHIAYRIQNKDLLVLKLKFGKIPKFLRIVKDTDVFLSKKNS